eukprot:221961_1
MMTNTETMRIQLDEDIHNASVHEDLLPLLRTFNVQEIGDMIKEKLKNEPDDSILSKYLSSQSIENVLSLDVLNAIVQFFPLNELYRLQCTCKTIQKLCIKRLDCIEIFKTIMERNENYLKLMDVNDKDTWAATYFCVEHYPMYECTIDALKGKDKLLYICLNALDGLTIQYREIHPYKSQNNELFYVDLESEVDSMLFDEDSGMEGFKVCVGLVDKETERNAQSNYTQTIDDCPSSYDGEIFPVLIVTHHAKVMEMLVKRYCTSDEITKFGMKCTSD